MSTPISDAPNDQEPEIDPLILLAMRGLPRDFEDFPRIYQDELRPALQAAHPEVEIRTVTAHSHAGQPLIDHQPHLRSRAHLTLQDTTPEVIAKEVRHVYPTADDMRQSAGPILRGTVGAFDCRVVAAHDAGDHVIYVGRVEWVRVDADAEPLLHQSSRYGAFSGR